MEETAENQPVHRHRRRKKRRNLKLRVLKISLWIVFFLAWGYAVMRITRHLGQQGELGKKYHEVDPAGFEKGITAGGNGE